MFDARTTEFIRATPEAVLDFVMNIEDYQTIDRKIRPLRWVRREPNFTEFAFRTKVGRLRGPMLVSQERLTPGRRVDITLAPAPYNRLIRFITDYEASFECQPVPGGTKVTRSERLRFKWPMRWFVGPFVYRTMPGLVREELRLAKQKLEQAAPNRGEMAWQ